MDNACVALAPLTSVARTVKLETCAVVGVPEITPAASSESPAGRVPPARLQLNGRVPPLAVNVSL